MNGSDNGTTFTDSSNAAHTMTPTNAVTKTAVQKFGTASGYFDGYHDYLSTPDSADWDVAGGDFTIDAWVRGAVSNNGAGLRPVIAQWEHQVSTEFTTDSYWSTYNAGTVGNTKGYIGAVFDGRYVYYIPSTYDGTNYHGKVLRYDTRAAFGTAGSWASYDAGAVGGLTTKGYSGASFDGRYIYFSPYWNGSAYHGKILRYDTQNDASFNTAGNWTSYNAENEDGTNTIKGYWGSAFDGRYVYFVPFYNGTTYHGKVLRFDTTGTFSDTASWVVYNASAVGGLNTTGYGGAIFDGQYIYFAPYEDSTGVYHGRVLRYNTQNDASFTTAGNWSSYDAGNTSSLTTKGYIGGTFDGQYVYFAPYYDGTSAHGKVLRYNTQGTSFTTSADWEARNCESTSGLSTKGYWGAIFDGQYVWFVPYWDATVFHSKFLRYSIQGSFTAAGSWSARNAGSIGTNTIGYAGAVSDGRYLYFAPYREAGSTFHAKALRYDTKSAASTPVFKLIYGDLSYDGGLGGGPIGPSFYFNIGSYVYGLHAKQILSADTWYHLAVARSSNDYKLYVGGVLKDSLTLSGTIDSGSSYLTVGELSNGGYNASFKGYLDEARLYKGAAYWTAAFTPPTTEY
jgi:hypothetical protein